MKSSNYIFLTAGIFSIFSTINARSIYAQIVTDGTTPTSITCSVSCQITGGTQAGINLFHSFSEFNINPNQEVFFQSPGITNIFSSVTGSNSSQILGKLGIIGDANLFLINPNGITFGANSSLSINGSFVATTANAVEFENRGFFDATNPSDLALLTVAPSAFLFNQLAPSAIAIQSASFKVGNNQSLLLLGGDVTVNAGVLIAPGGNIELAGLNEAGTIEINSQGNNLSLTFPASVNKANISISDNSNINVNAGNGGNITINAQDLNIFQSNLQTKNTGNFDINKQAGDIILIATENIQIQESSITNNDVLEPIGKPGSIHIKAGSLLIDDADIQTANANRESIGGVFLQVNGAVTIQNNSEIFTNTNGGGNASEISIKSGSLLIDDSGLFANTFGEGDAGNISIQTGALVLNHQARLFSSTEASTGIGGKGGEIVVDAKTVSLANGTAIIATTSTSGQAGIVVINAEDSISLANSAIFSDTSSQGDGGNTQLNTKVLTLKEGAIISTGSSGAGKAGDLQITATDLVSISGINPNSLTSFIELLPDK